MHKQKNRFVSSVALKWLKPSLERKLGFKSLPQKYGNSESFVHGFPFPPLSTETRAIKQGKQKHSR